MNKIDIAKKIVTTVVAIGTSKIVKSVIENNVPTEKATDKVVVTAASLAIGGACGELASEYTDKQIDQLVALWQKIKNKNETAK